MQRCARSWTARLACRANRCGAREHGRGAYWKTLGNTPGHLNHWSSGAFKKLLSQYGEVVELRSPSRGRCASCVSAPDRDRRSPTRAVTDAPAELEDSGAAAARTRPRP